MRNFVQINNLLNHRYYTAAKLGPSPFDNSGNFIARPFPSVNGDFPIRTTTFFAPGAPIGAWGGIRFREDCGIDWDEWKGLLRIPTLDRPWHRIKKQTAAMPSVTGRRLRVSSSTATGRSTGPLGAKKNPPKKMTSRTEVNDQPAGVLRRNSSLRMCAAMTTSAT